MSYTRQEGGAGEWLHAHAYPKLSSETCKVSNAVRTAEQRKAQQPSSVCITQEVIKSKWTIQGYRN